MPGKQKLELVSMYLHQPVLGAHGIALELEASSPDRLEGKVRLDPNVCAVDLWGDRGACTKIAFQEVEVEATKRDTEDPQGLRRVHWTLELEGMPDARLNLIQYPSEGLYYMTVEDGEAISAVVPFFEASLFAPEAAPEPGDASE